MLNQKIIKNVFFILFFPFLYDSIGYGCNERAEEAQSRSSLGLVPKLPTDMLTDIFKVGQQDRSLLKKLRVVCKSFRGLDTELDGFFFRLNQENIVYYKKRPYSSIILRVETLRKDIFFFERDRGSFKKITTLIVVDPEAREDNTLNLSSFVSLHNLASLTCRNRILKKKDGRSLILLTSLTNLDLTGVIFQEFNGTSYLTRLSNLKRLVLKGPIGNKTTFKNISRLTNLIELNVWRSALSEQEIVGILNLTQLRKLNIDGNMYEIDTFKGIECLTRLTSLEVLSLDGDVAKAYRDFILSLTRLKKLILDGKTCDPKGVFPPSLKSKSATM